MINDDNWHDIAIIVILAWHISTRAPQSASVRRAASASPWAARIWQPRGCSWFHLTFIEWGFPKMGVPQNRWFWRENPMKVHDFGGTPMYWTLPNVSHRSTEKSRRFESCQQERNCKHIPICRNILWAEARSLSQAATHSSPQNRKFRSYLRFKWCTDKLMEASYFAPMPYKFIWTYWNGTDLNNIQKYFKKDFLL